MAKCEDCDTPVVWLRKPDGGWMPPTEPLFDFAYNDHFTASVEGVAQPVPQVYKRHECLSWEDKQLKLLEREREKQRLIEEDRERKAEATRVARELERARRAQDAAEQKLAEQLEREAQRKRDRATRTRREKEAVRLFGVMANRFPKRMLPYACEDCGAEPGEACRTDQYDKGEPYMWWQATGHGSRYRAAPPDDRSNLRHEERWGPHYQGPWPPAANDPGRYEMRNWLLGNYLYVFTPEKVWLSDDEQENLTSWLVEFGEIFKEVGDGPEGVVDEGGVTGGGEAGGGQAGWDAWHSEGMPDRVDPF